MNPLVISWILNKRLSIFIVIVKVVTLNANQVIDNIVKHIDIRYYLISNEALEKTFELVKIDNKLSLIDILIRNIFWKIL